MKVQDILNIAHSVGDKMIITSPNVNLLSVSRTITEKSVGALPVLHEGKLVGIISERDLVRAAAVQRDFLSTFVKEFMTTDPVTVSAEEDLLVCHDLMQAGRFRHLPVMNGEKLIGIVSIRDILVALLNETSQIKDDYERFILSNH